MRLIDADVAYKVLAEYYHHRTETQYKALKEALSKVPTVDAVPVIRCKDCKHRNRYECDRIRLGETKCGVTDDWFCADGERKEDHA